METTYDTSEPKVLKSNAGYCVQKHQELMKNLTSYSDEDLVQELRRRGIEVTAIKTL